MIQSFTITNYIGEELVLELAEPEKSGIAVLSVSGLGPTTTNVTTTKVAGMDGTMHTQSILTERQITMKIKPLDNLGGSIEDRRQMIYRLFPIKKPFKFSILTDNRNCYTTAYVKECTPDIFSSFETIDIVLVCPDPYFYQESAVGGTLITFNGIDSLFEFEFENDSLEEDLIEFGDIRTNPVRNVIYEGDIDIGLEIHLHALGTATNFSFYNSLTKEAMVLNTDLFPDKVIKAGDDVYISTLRGNKTITLVRDGEEINVINSLGKNASWFKLTTGDNVFIYDAKSGMTNLEVTLKYREAYEGV